MQVLVTGADGFIGAQIVRTLQEQGHGVLGAVYDREARDQEVRIDLTRAAGLTQLPSGIAAVVHAAGIVDPCVSSAAMHAVNVGGTRNLLGWARAQRVNHFVHVSSVAVYGPQTVGTGRSERTPRLGRLLGLPYMRTKAEAERAVEASGLPYTLLRPPAVLGPGDTVISHGFFEALRGEGVPLVAGASPERRVSLSFVSGLADIVALALTHGPTRCALHAVDAELTLGELTAAYAQALGVAPRFTNASWSRAVSRRDDAGFAWLVASGRFGQQYTTDRLREVLGYRPQLSVTQAVNEAVERELQAAGALSRAAE